MSRIPGAGRDLARLIETHLFVVCPNNSGSTFLTAALEACRGVWRLPQEGQHIRGFAGPVDWQRQGPDGWKPSLLWAAEARWIDLFADPRNHDWPRTRKAWYFHAHARVPDATVFVTKSPPHVLHTEQLVRHFPNTRFLFMVRNPYAVCEGICRRWRYRTGLRKRYISQFVERGKSLEETAAKHVANCLVWQRRNIEAHGDRSVFFTYETMCADPAGVARRIRALVPRLGDLNLRQRLVVKDYDEMLTDMNARQIARLADGQIAAFNRVFEAYLDLFDYFGYDALEASGAAERSPA